MVMNLTADKQKSVILLSMAVTILPEQSCKGLYFMADHPVWMIVCLVRHVHNHLIGRPFQH
jgi:hypothetical protein